MDPMVIYHEMMEAKQSRSQDSQSELDVLCSESDSDGEHDNRKRLKRKKVGRHLAILCVCKSISILK